MTVYEFVDEGRGLTVTVEVKDNEVTVQPSDLGVLDFLVEEEMRDLPAAPFLSVAATLNRYVFHSGDDAALFFAELTRVLRFLEYDLVSSESSSVDPATGVFPGAVS